MYCHVDFVVMLPCGALIRRANLLASTATYKESGLQKLRQGCVRTQNNMGQTFEICKTESHVLLAAGGTGEDVEGAVVLFFELLLMSE